MKNNFVGCHLLSVKFFGRGRLKGNATYSCFVISLIGSMVLLLVSLNLLLLNDVNNRGVLLFESRKFMAIKIFPSDILLMYLQ